MKPTKIKPLKPTQPCVFNELGELVLVSSQPPTQENMIIKLNEIITQLNILIDNSINK